MNDILDFAKTCQTQYELFLFDLVQPIMNGVIDELSFFDGFFITQIANNKSINFMIQDLFHTSIKKT